MKTVPLAQAFPWDEFERVVILSPHLDDAALSCGGLLNFLTDRQASCLIISVYCGDPPSVRSKDGAFRSNLRKGHASPTLRRREDVAAMRSAEADFVHLGFTDGIFRRSPLTDQFIYRQARERWSAPRVDDLGHVEELYLVLSRLCLNLGRILLVSPMAIGQHVDHTIVARVALRLAEQGLALLFFEDFPYVVNPQVGSGTQDDPARALGRLGQESVVRMVLPLDVKAKTSLIGNYKSQVPVLFEDEAGLSQAIQSHQHEGEPCEYYWLPRAISLKGVGEKQ
jgi:LmbE family N-acetylglucosaminyl deacetylase